MFDDKFGKSIIGIGCLVYLAYFAFWGFILWLAYKIVMHFIK